MTGVATDNRAADEKRPFWLRCGACEHVWPAGELPMPAIAWANLLRKAECPRCHAGAQHLRPVTQRDGKLVELQVGAR